MEVRNNREYDAIVKELELNKLDVQLAEKFLHAAYDKLTQANALLVALNKELQFKQNDLLTKEKELAIILQASETEEVELYSKRKEITLVLGELLYVTYERIRNSFQNNLCVVPVHKGACGGCCILIPPQQKLEVNERSKVVLCEHCGRILVASAQSMDAILTMN